jgi:hypothetical protein
MNERTRGGETRARRLLFRSPERFGRTLLACTELLISRSALAPRSSASGSNDDVTDFLSSFAHSATATGAATAAAPSERRAPYADTALRSIAGERCACVSPSVYGGSESRFGRCAPRAGSPVARRALARDGDGSARSHRSLLPRNASGVFVSSSRPRCRKSWADDRLKRRILWANRLRWSATNF